jgi:CRP-like cAMP-binding protein
MQVAGHGQRIKAAALRHCTNQSATLHRSLLRFSYAFMVQTSHTALANGRSKIDERLARWLLMAHDRVEWDTLPLTHEFLSVMLGVRRPGVTGVLTTLKERGLIEVNRGLITIVDRKGLEKAANGTYGAPVAEFRRMLA